MPPQLVVTEQRGSCVEFADRGQEAAGSDGGIADQVLVLPLDLSTMVATMWRGVRNWPFWPAEAILASMYSYTPPFGVAVAHVELVDDLGEQPQPGIWKLASRMWRGWSCLRR